MHSACPIQVSIAKALLPVLKEEAEHVKVQEIVRRPRETEVRATCGECSQMVGLITHEIP